MKNKKYKYKHLVFAGTFDRLHIGHKKLLDLAFKLGERVSIGITSKKMHKTKPLANLICTWQVRRGAVGQYLRQQKWLKRVKFFRLKDIYGPSITSTTLSTGSLGIRPPFDSILVSKFTRENAEKINKKRSKAGLRPLKIIVASLVRGEDGEVVTSERIRMGEIDRQGHNFHFSILNFQKRSLILPRELRPELRKPLGRVFRGSVDQLPETAKKILQSINRLKLIMVITVGDIITMALSKSGFEADMKIIDFKSRRKPINSRFQYLNPKQYQNSSDKNSKRLDNSNLFTISDFGFRIYNNPPGTINIKTAFKIYSAIKKFIEKKEKSWIIVEGEEDLLVLPVILFAPLGSLVLYGQMDLGVVVVEVTEEKKREVEKILKKFK